MKSTALLSAGIASIVSVVATLAVIWLALPALAAAEPRHLEADVIRLVGSDGTPRFDVAETAFGGANLRILNKDVTRAQLVSGTRDRDSVGFSLFDTAGQRRVWLALKQGRVVGTSGDLTGIAMMDDQQRIRVHVGLDGNGDPFIWLLDANGNPVWSAP